MLEKHDDTTYRCPQLGGTVPFKYCRSMNSKLPCIRIIQCWGMKFDIGEWLEKNFEPEQLEKAFTPDTRSRIDKILQIAHDAGKKK